LRRVSPFGVGCPFLAIAGRANKADAADWNIAASLL
jgi:hypothetical protein